MTVPTNRKVTDAQFYLTGFLFTLLLCIMQSYPDAFDSLDPTHVYRQAFYCLYALCATNNFVQWARKHPSCFGLLLVLIFVVFHAIVDRLGSPIVEWRCRRNWCVDVGQKIPTEFELVFNTTFCGDGWYDGRCERIYDHVKCEEFDEITLDFTGLCKSQMVLDARAYKQWADPIIKFTIHKFKQILFTILWELSCLIYMSFHGMFAFSKLLEWLEGLDSAAAQDKTLKIFLPFPGR